jgi:hypothetical protein
MAVLNTNPRFKAKVVNSVLKYDNQELFSSVLQKFNNKDVVVTIELTHTPIDKDLYAFYFGIIIRKECMSSEQFQGSFNEMDIHEMLQKEFRNYVRVAETIRDDGTIDREAVYCVDNTLLYDKSNFMAYLNDVILYLGSEFNIHVKDYDQYVIDKNRYTKTNAIWRRSKEK